MSIIRLNTQLHRVVFFSDMSYWISVDGFKSPHVESVYRMIWKAGMVSLNTYQNKAYDLLSQFVRQIRFKLKMKLKVKANQAQN